MMEIWPAIDIRGGQCVRLRQGDYGQETVYGNSPADMAEYWVGLGAKRLHLVDLDGAKDGKMTNRPALEAVVRCLAGRGVACELGGGIRNEESIRGLLEMGLTRLVIGTLALKDPAWFRAMCLKFPNRLVLGIDARNGMVATDGWLETSRTSAVELANQFAALVYTDIATDGMMTGPNIPEMLKMKNAVPIPLVASGGISVADDVRRLYDAGFAACIIGRALYEKTVQLQDVLPFERD